MRTYELVVVLKPVPEADRKKLLETVKFLLKGVKMLSEKEWGSKALKYKIKHELTGFYYDFEFEAEKVPADFEKRMINTDGVLRHLVVRKK
jgi:ribosomal protein S6